MTRRAVVTGRARGFAFALLASCSGAAHRTGTLPPVVEAPGVVAHIRATDETDATAAGAGAVGVPASWQLDASVAVVRADAAVGSGERAWLVAHISDDPDRSHVGESPNVRSLAALGADGVHAVAALFARGEGNRVPFARRVIERVAQRACREYGFTYTQRLIAWLEAGTIPRNLVTDAAVLGWTREVDERWPREAITRLDRWADAGVPCFQSRPATIDAAVDDTGSAPAPTGDAANAPTAPTDAGASR